MLLEAALRFDIVPEGRRGELGGVEMGEEGLVDVVAVVVVVVVLAAVVFEPAVDATAVRVDACPASSSSWAPGHSSSASPFPPPPPAPWPTPKRILKRSLFSIVAKMFSGWTLTFKVQWDVQRRSHDARQAYASHEISIEADRQGRKPALY